jgi:hypothetical protein
MIESLGKQLNGKVTLRYETTGLVYALDAPLSALKPPDPAVTAVGLPPRS